MKRTFRFLLAFASEDGSKVVAEFDTNEDYLEFKRELDSKAIVNQLVNERECQALQYKGAHYLDMRG